ncbi:hypothetical protein jhhlp_003708, partial [Lomentospora prolificans]
LICVRATNTMESHHHITVRELDLSACHPTSIVDKINAVPALKTSTAFFTFLRANLALNHSALSSQTNTPLLEPTITCVPSSPSPLGATTPLVPLELDDDIPPLSLEVLTDDDDKTDALQLVADSVGEQRKEAAVSLATNPVCVVGLVTTMALSYRYYHGVSGNLPMAIVVCGALVVGYLVAAYYLTAGYNRLAQEVIPSWMSSGDCRRDMVLAARKGNEIIAALILTLEPSFTQMSRRRGRHASLRGGRCVIKAWTTAKAHRGEGVGVDLLTKAAKLTREKCGRDAAIGFAKEHVHSTMILPEMFNGSFRKREMKATKLLDEVLADIDNSRKKR